MNMVCFCSVIIDYDRWQFEIIKIEINEKSVENSLALIVIEKSIF